MCYRTTCSSVCATHSPCTSVQTIPTMSRSLKSAFFRKRCVSCVTPVPTDCSCHRSDSPLRRHGGAPPIGHHNSRLLFTLSLLSLRSHARVHRRPLSRSSGESDPRDRSGVSPRLACSTVVHNLLFDCLFFPLRSTPVASFLNTVSLQLCRHVAAALTLEPPHSFLVSPHLPVTLRHTLVKQPRFASLPLPAEWKQSDADVEWRRAWHVGLVAR